jgi:hypothetical protein
MSFNPVIGLVQLIWICPEDWNVTSLIMRVNVAYKYANILICAFIAMEGTQWFSVKQASSAQLWVLDSWTKLTSRQKIVGHYMISWPCVLQTKFFSETIVK